MESSCSLCKDRPEQDAIVFLGDESEVGEEVSRSNYLSPGMPQGCLQLGDGETS